MKLNLFYNKNKATNELEDTILKRLESFIEKLKNDKKLNNHVLSFGIVWPCARWQWYWSNEKSRSDIDFFALTSQINPSADKYLKNEFDKIFEKKLDCWILIWNKKRSYLRPDLMFFEYVTSGNFLYWTKPEAITFDKISKFEVFRNLIYRSHFFLKMFEIEHGKMILKNKNKELFLYHYSKIIFSIEEVILILTGNYIADNFGRKNRLVDNKLIKLYPNNFLDIHNTIFKYRFDNIIPESFDYDMYINNAFKLLETTYSIIWAELFNNRLDDIKFIHPNLLSHISTNIFFTIRYWNLFRKIRFNFWIESFIKLTLYYYSFIQDINKQETLKKEKLQKILEFCKVSPWFYYKI